MHPTLWGCFCSTVSIAFVLAPLTCLISASEHGHSHGHSHGSSASSSKPASITASTVTGEITGDGTPTPKIPIRSRSRARSDSFASLYGHPAATRASLVQTAHDIASARSPSPSRGRIHPHSLRTSDIHSDRSAHDITEVSQEEEDGMADTHDHDLHEETPLLAAATGTKAHNHSGHIHSPVRSESSGHSHEGHGHSHAGSMNMRALLLHVLGDALGNVGVIATGLIIWLTSWSYKYYCDPVISLVITVIIFSSALPLGMSSLSITVILRPNGSFSSAKRFFHPSPGRTCHCLH